MAIQITSTTDTEEQVSQAMAVNAPESKVEDKKSATAPEEKVETVEDSEASKNDELEKAQEDEESDADEESDESDKDELPKGMKKRLKRFRRQISERDQTLSQKEQRIAFLESELSKKATSSDSQSKETPSNQNINDEPKEEDFESHKDYIRALAKYEVQQEKVKEDQKSKEAQAKSEHQKSIEKFQNNCKELGEANDEFYEALDNIKGIPESQALTAAILDSDNGHEVLFELAKDKDEYARINGLSYGRVCVEIGKIEARLALSKESKSSKETTKKTTNAPPPPKPLGQSSSSGQVSPSEFSSLKEFRKWEEKHSR